MSNASLPCRIEWRASRWALFAALTIALLAAVAIGQSALPDPIRYLAMAAVLALALWRTRRESRRTPWVLHWPGLDRNATRIVAGREQPVVIVAVQLRGPLAGVSLNDGVSGITHSLWWPDTLDASSRRALRLMAQHLARVPASPDC